MRNLEISNWMTRLLALTMLAGMVLMAGCGDDDGDEPAVNQNVWEVINSDSRLSLLAAELEAAGLDGALATTNNITVFAPSNAALQTLLTQLGLPDFSPIRDELAVAVLTYHVATSIKMASDLTVGSEITTLQGELIEVAGGPTLVSGATNDAGFIETDIEATNGVVHVIDVVLVPPLLGEQIVGILGTVAQPILLAEDFSILASGILKADAGKPVEQTIVGAMVGLDDITVFAPVDAVFNGAGITVDTYTAEEWDAIIRGHAVPATLSPLTDASGIATVNAGVTLTTTAPNGNLGTVQGSGNDAAIPVVAEGLPAGNGITYPIGGVIL
ncbi:fasciclin domain-containing protein [Fulvivirga sedimenti]|uniref:Fasciclin domain-containing protein n=1 Tax=Fulvivirga sedimenti TaxID=2879465 RepID=A0A9X1KUB7_9BACT|nr:fasciclin domain-containing protein [Fulvivirga sedimenti]MCA6073323.1 fasciclin domain-containing protein [Fulvivirga sedimenti]